MSEATWDLACLAAARSQEAAGVATGTAPPFGLIALIFPNGRRWLPQGPLEPAGR